MPSCRVISMEMQSVRVLAHRHDRVDVTLIFIGIRRNEKFTTNLTNRAAVPRSPHDALVLELAMRPEVGEQVQSISF
jgi:hypothetical protein